MGKYIAQWELGSPLPVPPEIFLFLKQLTSKDTQGLIYTIIMGIIALGVIILVILGLLPLLLEGEYNKQPNRYTQILVTQVLLLSLISAKYSFKQGS